MPFDAEDNTFLLAGPVKMHPRVLRAMSVPAVAHRSPDFTAVNRDIEALTKHVFQTRNDVAILAGSGTAGMEAAAASLLKKGDKAVALDNGKFGNRMGKLASLYGDATVLSAPWGQPFDLAELDRTLGDVKPKALFLTHNETSCGFTQPLKDIARIAREHDALVVADCITSIGGMDVPLDAWGVDVAIVGSQKSLGAPSGLCLVTASDRAQERMYGDQGFYLNLPRNLKKLREDGQTPFTPAIPLHFALREALRLIQEEGLQNRFAKVRAQAEAVRSALTTMGLELFVPEGYRSDTVTAARYPEGVTDKDFRGGLKDRYGVVVAGGQNDVKGKIFRVGHMGTASFPDLAGGLAAIEKVLSDLGAPIKRGAWSEAFTQHM